MPRQIGPIRARLEYTAIGALAAPLRLLDRERAVRLGARLGTLAASLDRFDRSVAMRNLEIAFPALSHTQRLAILRAAYENWGRMLAEWMHFPEMNADNIERFASYRHIENWHRAQEISNGRGILILTGHFGNWELLILAHSVHGNRVAVVHRPVRNPLIDTAMSRSRTSFGNAIIPRKGAARSVFRMLKQNWMVAIPLDLDVRRGVFVDFFSLKASTSDALARLALATGAPVMPAFMVRDAASTHHWLECLEPLAPLYGKTHEESVILNTQRYTAIIEEMVRRHPDHWNWIHRRWKTRPPGEPRFY